jgi:hypothetical protein
MCCECAASFVACLLEEETLSHLICYWTWIERKLFVLYVAAHTVPAPRTSTYFHASNTLHYFVLCFKIKLHCMQDF